MILSFRAILLYSTFLLLSTTTNTKCASNYCPSYYI